tara:strand:- start:603 stop:722 length:120 start_codon:yes stop_codon:yes gene_type:complete
MLAKRKMKKADIVSGLEAKLFQSQVPLSLVVFCAIISGI